MKCLALAAVTCAGCILPLSTGAPLPATTLGRGHLGAAFSEEAPVLDLLADEKATDTGTQTAIDYGAAPAGTLTATLSYGVDDDTDVEIAAEGAFYYFVFPAPTGASVGLRHHLAATDRFDFAIAARVGHVSNTTTTTDMYGTTTESGASATYGALQGVMQVRTGAVRPLFALNLMPSRVSRRFDSDPDYDFNGMASSLTVGLMIAVTHITFGPYVTVTNFYSDRFDNSGVFVSGGLMFAIRPDRNPGS